jgi:hypothetical protein
VVRTRAPRRKLQALAHVDHVPLSAAPSAAWDFPPFNAYLCTGGHRCNPKEDPYERNGHTARTLLRAPDLRVLLIVIKGGSRMATPAIASASIHALSSQLRLHLPDRTVELRAGHLLALGGGLRHDVEAAIDSTFVLTLGWHDEH